MCGFDESNETSPIPWAWEEAATQILSMDRNNSKWLSKHCSISIHACERKVHWSYEHSVCNGAPIAHDLSDDIRNYYERSLKEPRPRITTSKKKCTFFLRSKILFLKSLKKHFPVIFGLDFFDLKKSEFDVVIRGRGSFNPRNTKHKASVWSSVSFVRSRSGILIPGRSPRRSLCSLTF